MDEIAKRSQVFLIKQPIIKECTQVIFNIEQNCVVNNMFRGNYLLLLFVIVLSIESYTPTLD